MTFIHDFGQAAPKPIPPSREVKFKATIEGQRALKDGGLNITLGLSEGEVVAVAKLLAMRGFILDVTILPEEAKKYG